MNSMQQEILGNLKENGSTVFESQNWPLWPNYCTWETIHISCFFTDSL